MKRTVLRKLSYMLIEALSEDPHVYLNAHLGP